MKIEYPAKIEKDEDGNFLVEFIDIEEAFTEGKNLEEALFNASEVLTLCLEQRIEDKEDIPEPSYQEAKDNNIYMIIPETGVQASLLIKKTRANRSLAELARSLETSWPSVQRLENPRNATSIKMLNKTAAVFGKKLVLSFE